MLFVGCLLLCGLLLFHPLTAQLKDHVDGEVLVMLNQAPDLELISGAMHKIGEKEIRIRNIRTLSQSMHIYQMAFPAQEVDEFEVLKYLDRHPSVKIVQFNHYVESRATIPNDPQFGTLWGMNNTGQSGGKVDADIDAPEAWDINHGGLSSMGDTVVIAIIDGGFDLNHEDIDFWKNHNEIPNNNIDDDGNGYVDDVNGWDAYTSSPNISTSGSHGTHVCGTAGAIGNNNIGVTGVCWNAKIMPVGGSSGTESVVVEAYAYVRDNRRLYNQTNGAKGAFVVSTNSSFGVNNGLPANFPLWCAMYDSLGAVGILSAAATMNSSQDVDAQSDIPTACPSDWMVAVTNTTRNDTKNSGAAWGLTTIDLGSPGTDVLSSTPGNTYQSFTGTSMATPHVAGAIGLIVSTACPSLLADYKNNPAAVAITFRDFLFDGVDSIAALQNITVTGGRLNVFNSLQLVDNWCATGGCVVPFALSVSNVTDQTCTLNWGSISASQSYDIRWKATAAGTWNTDSVTVTHFNISGLQACTEYEFQIQTVCDTNASGWSPSFVFTSEGCCTAPASPKALSTTDSTATLTWKPVFAAQGYNLQYRIVGSGTWTTLVSPGDTATVLNLESCTDYEFRVETQCDTGGSGYSAIIPFKTLGCGLCAEGGYCVGTFDAGDEWIESVSIASMTNSSGSDGGYADFTSNGSTVVLRGNSYPVSLTPGYAGFQFNEYWRIYIDLNGDADFADPGELVYDAGSPVSTVVSGTMTIPATASLGISRMRVMMRFNTGPNPCDDGNYGEIEDYCVTIADTILGENPAVLRDGLVVYPNPAHDRLTISSSLPLQQIILTDLTGKVMLSEAGSFVGEKEISLSHLSDGIYLLTAISEKGKWVRKVVLSR